MGHELGAIVLDEAGITFGLPIEFGDAVKLGDVLPSDMISPMQGSIRIGSIDQHTARVLIVPPMGRVVAPLKRRLVAENV